MNGTCMMTFLNSMLAHTQAVAISSVSTNNVIGMNRIFLFWIM